jgi:hypothetical protein
MNSSQNSPTALACVFYPVYFTISIRQTHLPAIKIRGGSQIGRRPVPYSICFPMRFKASGNGRHSRHPPFIIFEGKVFSRFLKSAVKSPGLME